MIRAAVGRGGRARCRAAVPPGLGGRARRVPPPPSRKNWSNDTHSSPVPSGFISMLDRNELPASFPIYIDGGLPLQLLLLPSPAPLLTNKTPPVVPLSWGSQSLTVSKFSVVLTLESEMLSLLDKHCQAPASCRPRFAENPILGTTREPSSTRLFQRKSALPPACWFSQPQRLRWSTWDPSINFTAPSLVVPSSSSKRARATSMIADHNSLWFNPYLLNPDSAHSMSDFNTPEPLPQRQPDHQLYLFQQTIALTHKFARYVLPVNMTGSISACLTKHKALMLHHCDSLEFSDHSRPVLTSSLSATAPLSSTLTPPPDPLAVPMITKQANWRQKRPQSTTGRRRLSAFHGLLGILTDQ
ncbi:uncharacterized protein VP01_515g12 [Puccinia sorghi]|uniref:Uncharacterized protein n=1 Tax=Puccinia sorghi TaxID=27349 RepID=A0A0L6UKX4_9BASI|nr:uncharacterized protein VP01_515g12 [Puccinia sorghi]